MDETKIEVTVPEFYAGEAQKALDKLIAKARRYGCDAIEVETRPDVVERKRYSQLRQEHVVDRHPVVVFTITGAAPRVPGFRLLARIERTDAGNFVDVVPGREGEADPAWRTVEGRCDHCEKARRRKLVFAVERESDGARMLVGRRCLRDYLGIDDPARVMAHFDFFRRVEAAFGDPDDEGFLGGGGPRGYYALSLLTQTATVVRLKGWTSKAAAQKAAETAAAEGYESNVYPTSSSVMFALGPRPSVPMAWEAAQEWDRLHEERPEDVATAEAALEWVKASTDSSDYMHNLRVALAGLIVDYRRANLAMSAIGSYLRDQDRLEKRREAEKNAPAKVNAPSGRHTVRATVKSVRTDATDWGDTLKALYVVATPEGEWRAWGTVPAAIRGEGESLVGREVDLTATFKPKVDDPAFAFVSRPYGKLIEYAA